MYRFGTEAVAITVTVTVTVTVTEADLFAVLKLEEGLMNFTNYVICASKRVTAAAK